MRYFTLTQCGAVKGFSNGPIIHTCQGNLQLTSHLIILFNPFVYTCITWYSDKTDHGQNGPDKTDHVQDKTDHVSGQNGPRFRTKRTTFRTKRTMFHDQRDQVSGPNGPRSGPNGPRFRTKWTKLNDKLSFVYRITFALKYLLQCSDGQ